jgi:DNA-binding Lrp family transcriptional regulator
MAVGAYILIQTDVGLASDVMAQVRRLPGVSAADGIAGPYDVIARAEADTIDALGRFVISQVQSIEGVTRTLTCPIVAL